MSARLFTFVGGETGPWSITKINTIAGESLIPNAGRLNIINGAMDSFAPEQSKWTLRGITSNERYVIRQEKEELVAKQPVIGRTQATCAALIPIRKTDAWWALTQDERRRIFEERSNHTQTGLKYLPAIARRLHHCRDLATPEPFDFLTWFEYAPTDADAFDELLASLRASEEWTYVDREIDIRLVREPA